MTFFSADSADLADRVAYELETLEYLRTTLYGQGESSGAGVTVTLGELTPEGNLRRHIRMLCTTSISEAAVRVALDRFRPLAFGAAFKMQDMVVEWVLRANGESAWRFSDKLKAYDRLRAASGLIEPTLFAEQQAVARAFWELYRHLSHFRNAAIHAGGVMLRADGTVSITDASRKLEFSAEHQAAYLRATCLVVRILTKQRGRDPLLDNLLESDLHTLEPFHLQAGLVVRGARIAALTVNVPETFVVDRAPLAIRIDFDQLRSMMEKTHPPPANGKLWFSARICAQDDLAAHTWHLPIEAVPSGTVTIRVGDSTFDRYLEISAHLTREVLLG